ncbi:hypothetical protein [Sorangium sp. So ce542]|uniref:hypothetical protein n=1 Tax=Sorangium sp. So ce542 TaxID=3133316 RepID=UPI003F5EF26E
MSTLRASLLAGAAAILGAALMLGIGRTGSASVERKPSAPRRDPSESRVHASPQRNNDPSKELAAPPAPPTSMPVPDRTSPRTLARTARGPEEEAAAARVAERFEAKIRAFDAAPDDHEWAPRASVALNSDLDALSKKIGFSVESLSCKSKICVGSVRWDSVADAIRYNQRVAEASYSINCQIDVMGKLGTDDGNDSLMSVIFSNCQ